MDNQVIPYVFEEQEVRVIMDDQDDPWWVAKDVAGILGYGQASDMLRRLDDDEKDKIDASEITNYKFVTAPDAVANSKARWFLIINEFGLYNAILGSQKPQARKFKRWVTHELLPSIRKTGKYSATTAGGLTLCRADDDGLTPAARVRLLQLAILLANKDEAFIQSVNAHHDEVYRKVRHKSRKSRLPDDIAHLNYFLEHLCYINPTAESTKDELYGEYSDNAAIHGMEPMFRNLFFRQLYENTEAGAFYSNRNGVRTHMVRGIGLARNREDAEVTG